MVRSWIDSPTGAKVLWKPERMGTANSFLLTFGDEAWLFDPSGEPEAWGDWQTKVCGLWATHGHEDHISGVDRWRSASSIPLGGHALLSRYLEDASYNVSMLFGQAKRYAAASLALEIEPLSSERVELRDGLWMEVHAFPGHTEADVMYCIYEGETPLVLLTGDIIFAEGIGRNDFPGGSETQQLQSLREVDRYLRSLPGDLPVGAGHGAPVWVQQIVDGNPYLHWVVQS